MKRLNPDTGKPFVRGDTRADGFLFWQYKSEILQNGYFKEFWCDLKNFNSRMLNKISYDKRYRINNSQQLLKQKQKYHKENPHIYNAKSAKRRAIKLKRTPKWLSKSQLCEIRAFYKKAQDLSKETGTAYHVDHIIPLQGVHVSGLHVPWNLQILTADQNLRKSNKATE